MKYTIYNISTGMILSIGNSDNPKYNPAHEGLLSGIYNPFEYYIDVLRKEPHKKQIMILSVTDDYIKGVPINSILCVKELIDGEFLVETCDSYLELDDPGEYHVTVYNVKYHTGNIVINIK